MEDAEDLQNSRDCLTGVSMPTFPISSSEFTSSCSSSASSMSSSDDSSYKSLSLGFGLVFLGDSWLDLIFLLLEELGTMALLIG